MFIYKYCMSIHTYTILMSIHVDKMVYIDDSGLYIDDGGLYKALFPARLYMCEMVCIHL